MDITTLHQGSEVVRDGQRLVVVSVIEDEKKTYLELEKVDDFNLPLSEV